MTSTRLPGKILAPVEGNPLLWYVVSRTRQARRLDEVVVATTDRPTDDVVAAFCATLSIPCFRGSEDDVLDRYYQAAVRHAADVVVRLTADCPLLDPQVIDQVINLLLDGSYDYVSNTMEPTYPDGLDVEAFRFAVLEQAWREATARSEREHVTPYLWKQPETFRLGSITHPTNLSHLRWTVDEPEDLDFLRLVLGYLGTTSAFGMGEVLNVLHTHPELTTINANFQRNEGYQKSLENEIKRSGEGTE
jgi:spore coat polysaccharide biosynthesis protein SpsF